MAKKQLILSVPTPCTEDWNNMTPDKNGKFCASCQKTVVDFSRMTDAEIFNYFDTFQGATCGRFTEKQLRTPIIEPLVLMPQNRWAWALSALLLPTLAASQTVKMSEATEIVTPSVFQAKTKGNDVNKAKTKENITLRGVVWDNNYEVLAGVPIVVKGTNMGTLTDFDGRFELKLNEKDLVNDSFQIVVSYVGYNNKELRISPSETHKDLIINLEEGMVLGGAEVFVPRNFFQRTKYRIKRFFYRLRNK